MESYCIGDAVWAVIPECHYWPALVVEVKEGAKAWKKEKSTEDYIFIYFFGLASYGWISKGNILPYLENKEKLKLNSFEYFYGIDEISVTLFLLAGQEIDDYIKKRQVIYSEKDGPEKEKLLRELIINANTYERDFDRLRNCPSLLYAISSKQTKQEVKTVMSSLTKKYDDCKLPEEANLGKSKQIKRSKFEEQKLVSSTSKITSVSEEDVSIIQNYIEHSSKVHISDFWKCHISDTFSIGDLVWARMSGYVPWPGQVVEPPDKRILKQRPKNSLTVYYCICFYGTFSHAWIATSDLIPYNKYKRILSLKGIEDLCRKKQSVNSFDLACKQAEEVSQEKKDIQTGKIDPVIEAKNQEKRDREKRRYGFEIFNKRNKITSLAYENFLRTNLPTMPSKNIEIGGLNAFFMEIASDEYQKRISQMEQEEMDGIIIEVEQSEPICPPRKKRKKKSSKDNDDTLQEELEYDINTGYKFRKPKRVYRKKTSPKKKKKKKNYPNIEPYLSDDEQTAPGKNPIIMNEFQRLFLYLMSEDDVNGCSNTVSTNKINQLCSEILDGNLALQGVDSCQDNVINKPETSEKDVSLNNNTDCRQSDEHMHNNGSVSCNHILQHHKEDSDINLPGLGNTETEVQNKERTIECNQPSSEPKEVKENFEGFLGFENTSLQAYGQQNEEDSGINVFNQHKLCNVETEVIQNKEETNEIKPNDLANRKNMNRDKKNVLIKKRTNVRTKNKKLIHDIIKNDRKSEISTKSDNTLEVAEEITKEHILHNTNAYDGRSEPKEVGEGFDGFLGFENTSLQTDGQQNEDINAFNQPKLCNAETEDIQNKEETNEIRQNDLSNTILDMNNVKKNTLKRKKKNVYEKKKKLKHGILKNDRNSEINLKSDNPLEATKNITKEYCILNNANTSASNDEPKQVKDDLVGNLGFKNTSLRTYKKQSTKNIKGKQITHPSGNHTTCTNGSLKTIEVKLSKMGEWEDDLISQNLSNSDTESSGFNAYVLDDSAAPLDLILPEEDRLADVQQCIRKMESEMNSFKINNIVPDNDFLSEEELSSDGGCGLQSNKKSMENHSLLQTKTLSVTEKEGVDTVKTNNISDYITCNKDSCIQKKIDDSDWQYSILSNRACINRSIETERLNKIYTGEKEKLFKSQLVDFTGSTDKSEKSKKTMYNFNNKINSCGATSRKNELCSSMRDFSSLVDNSKKKLTSNDNQNYCDSTGVIHQSTPVCSLNAITTSNNNHFCGNDIYTHFVADKRNINNYPAIPMNIKSIVEMHKRFRAAKIGVSKSPKPSNPPTSINSGLRKNVEVLEKTKTHCNEDHKSTSTPLQNQCNCSMRQRSLPINDSATGLINGNVTLTMEAYNKDTLPDSNKTNCNPKDAKVSFIDFELNKSIEIIKESIRSGHKVVVWTNSQKQNVIFQNMGCEIYLSPLDIVRESTKVFRSKLTNSDSTIVVFSITYYPTQE